MRSRDNEPLVAVICAVPLMGEALSATLEQIAEVRSFPAGRGDVGGLLRALRPDAVVVDSDEEAGEAEAFARETHAPVVHVSLPERTLRLLRDERWEKPDADASPEAIRNVLVEQLYGRRRM